MQGLRELIDQLLPIAEAVIAADKDLAAGETIDRKITALQKRGAALEEANVAAAKRLEQANNDAHAVRAEAAGIHELASTMVASAKDEAQAITAKAQTDAADVHAVHSRRIDDLTKAIAAKEVELVTINGWIKDAKAKYNEIIDDMNALGSRLRV